MKRSLLLLSLLLVSLGCSDDDEPIPTANLEGLWTFTAGGSPPATLACNGAISGMTSVALCGTFDLELDQTGTTAVGTSTQPYCGRDFSAALVIDGNGIEGTITADAGSTVENFTFTGTVSGDTGLLDPATFSVEGMTGTCTTSGFYNAAR